MYVFFNRALKIKLAKLTFLTAISSHEVMGVISNKCEVWKINHAENGPFLATDCLKTKGRGYSHPDLQELRHGTFTCTCIQHGKDAMPRDMLDLK